MLPLKAGTVELGKESKQKLDFFYSRYCEGENGRQYGMGHIVFACHAAFPMFISPELANLTWLNFNSYANHRGIQKTDRVAVSDFLLSSLVRPVANRQYEMIPDIRTYLLALLQDGNWFNLFGITGFGETRLMELAQFLQAYLVNRKSNEENNANGFREVNEWAAFAYLQPNLLAGRIAAALEQTFSKNREKPDDELGQLRLNLLLERFSQQVHHKVYKDANNSKPGVFLNLYRYSKANRARLFEKTADEISDISYALDETFIGDALPNDSFIQLPLLKGAGERLKRKREGVERVYAVVIGPGGRGVGLNPDGSYLYNMRNRLLAFNTLKIFSVESVKMVDNLPNTPQQLIVDIQQQLNGLFEEDMVFLWYSDYYLNKLLDNDKGKINEYRGYVRDAIGSCRSQIKNRFFLILELENETNEDWTGLADVTLGIIRRKETDGKDNPINLAKAFFKILTDTKGKTSYHDLHKWLKYVYRNENVGVDISGSASEIKRFAFSQKSPVRNFDNLLIYDKEEETWAVLENDFVPNIPNTAVYVFEYDSGKQIEEVVGDMFMRNGKLAFGGKTEMLEQNNIYGLLGQRRPLYYELENNPTPELEHALNNLNFDDRFAWQFLVKRVINTNGPSPAQQGTAYLPRLIISSMDAGKIIGYELTFLEKGDGTKEEDKLNWWVDGLTALANSLQAFTSYHYLLKQASGNGLEALYPPFNIQISGFWQTGGAKENPLTGDLSINITPESIFTDNDRVRFHPYIVGIQSKEDFPVYVAVYLLLSNFQIRRIPLANSATVIPPNGSGTVLISDDELMESVAGGLLNVQIKILVSRNPIVSDFSQNGLN